MKSSPRPSASRSSLELSRRLIAAVALTLAGQVDAAPETWVGNVSPNWNDLNWSGVNPVPVAGDSLIFGVAGSAGSILNNDLAAGLSIVGINFNAGASAYTFNGNALTLAGNVVNGSVSLQTINLDLALTGLRTFTTTTGGGNVRLGGVLSGTGGVVKAGAGTLTLANSGNTFTGELNIGPGIVNVASVSDYGAPGSSIGARLQAQETAAGSGIGLHFTGGTLQYTGATPQSTNREIRILNGVTGGAIDASGTTPAATLSFTHMGTNTNLFDTGGTRTLTLTGTNTGDNSFSIRLTDQAASMTTLQKTGVGKWLIANSDNTYTGETIFGPGILNVASVSDYGVASSIGARSLFNEVSTTVTGIGLHFAGGTLQYTGSTPQSTNRNIRVLTGNGATIDASGSNPGATLSFTKTGANLNLFDTAGVRTFTLTGSNTGDNGFSIQLTNQAANLSNLVKSGVGTWVLNGPDSNFATGTTTVTGGTLVLGKNNALSVNGSLIIGSGANTAVARLGGSGGDQIANTSTLAFSGTGGILRMNNLHETVGGLVSAVGSGIVENESGVAGTSTFTVNSTATQSFGGVLRNGDGIGTDGVLAFTKAGTGTLTLAGANTHTGATTVGGGTLTITGSLGAGTTTTITNSTVNGAGMIQGAVNVGPGGVLATSGMVGGTVNINSFGTVNATGTFAGPMNIASVGTLSGTSTINGLVTAVGGARISPGSATIPGTLNVGSLTLESGAVINAEFGATSDFIDVTEATGLTLNGGSFNVFATGGVAPLTANGSYTLLEYEGALIGTSANLSIANAQFGKAYTVVDDMVNTLLTLTIADTTITEWNGVAGDGLWPNPGNWSAGAPNGFGTAALFGLIPTQSTIIDLSGPKTVGGIRFQNTMSYTLSGDGLSGDNLNLDNGDAAAVIEVITGNHTIAAPVVLAGDVNLAPATGTTLTVTGSISGAHGLTQTTAGTVILTGANSHTRTSVDAGTLQIGNGGTSGSLGSGDVTIASGATLVLNRSDDLAVANNIVGLGTLTKNALNTVTLTGANVFAALNVNTGTIKVGSAEALSQVTAVAINGGSLDLNEIDTTIGALSGSGGVITDNGGLATTTILTVNQASSTTYNGTIEEGAGQTVALTKIGAGTLTLAGTGANTYAGLTTITEGALTLAKTGVNAIVGNVQIGDASGSDFLNLGASDQIADASVLTFTAGNSGNSAFFHLNGFNETVQGITTTVGNAAVIANNNASIASVLTVDTQGNNYTYDGIIRNGAAGTMGLTKAGAGRLTLANTVTVATTSYTGATTINGGQLVLEDLTAFSSPITNNVAVTDSLIFNQSTRDGTATGVISGPGGVTKNGPNTLTLTGVNSFMGDFILNDGTFGIGANGAQGGGTIVINGGIIRASGAARALPNPVTVNGSFILGRLTDLNGSITLNANATVTASNFDGVANNNSLLGPVGGGFRLTLAEGAGGGIFSPFGLGTGALVVNAVNTNSGGTTIASGRVNVAAAGALANAPLAVNAGILNLNNPAQTVTLFEGTGGTVNFIAGHVLTVDQAGDSSVTSAIAGPGTLIKDGAGALTLSGPQSYAALITEGGTTTLTTSLPNATLTNNDGTLNLNASATSSVVNVNDTVNFGSNQRLAGLNIGAGGVATILSAAPGAPVFEGFESDGFASERAINDPVAAVPEPGTLSLLAAGALGLLGRRRRLAR